MLDSALTALLLASTFNLALMIPGGFVEVRDFSAYPSWILGLFNVFLTVLGLGGLVLAYFVFRQGIGYGLGALLGLAYIVVYLADLKKIFPVSPIPMSRLLAYLEWLGTLLGTLLTGTAVWATLHPSSHEGTMDIRISATTLIVLVAAGLTIVIFATHAATRQTRR